MKNLFTSCLIISALFFTACSESDKSNSKQSTEKSSKDGNDQNSSDGSKDDSGPKTITIDDIDPDMKVVEKVDDNGKIVKVTKDPKTGEEVVIVEKKVEEGNGDSNKENGSDATNSGSDEESDFNIHEYKKLDAFLGKYVSNGHVNYASIKKNKSELDAIIKEFKASEPSSSWTRDQKLAFWINAYNIFTIKLIIDNYPTSSITKIAEKPWEKKVVTIGSNTYSLNHVENGIIRKQFNEPRIHFALNCASESCPILLNKAYMPSKLSTQLTAQTKAFLNDTSKNTFSKKEANISRIFDWYGEDFPDVMDFIKKYHPLDYTPKSITYQEYSWELND